MKLKLWGTRGSIASCRPQTIAYGGNTSCVEIISEDTRIILDAGTGIHRLGLGLDKNDKIKKVHILISHLHFDHIVGLGFFSLIWDPQAEIHIYGPVSSIAFNLEELLTKYLSPPLFPVFLKDVACQLFLHEIGDSEFDLDDFHVKSQFICHPGPTLGYRISHEGAHIAYLCDHEPAEGVKDFPLTPDWTSGYELAKEVHLLIHDSQYTSEEYSSHIGWGHSSLEQALLFGQLANVENFVTFHHDPSHGDQTLDNMLESAIHAVKPKFNVYPGKEGSTFQFLIDPNKKKFYILNS